MHSGVPELGIDLLTLLFYSGLSSLLAYGGVLSELSALQQYSAGELGFALWYLFMGLVAFYGVASLVRDRVVPAVRTLV